MSPIRSILIRGVNWLGDAVMTIPALHRLNEAMPDARMVLLTPAKLADLWHRHPTVDKVVTIDPSDGVWTVGRKLRPYRFDLAILFPNSPRAAFEAWLSGARQRVGYARPWRDWLLTRAVPPHPDFVPMRKRPVDEIRRLVSDPQTAPAPPPAAESHHLFHYLRLVAAVGANPAPLAPYLSVRQDEQEEICRQAGLKPESDDKPWIGLNPGAEYGAAKRWPLDRFAATAAMVQKQHPCRWIVFGGPGDVELANQLQSRLAPKMPAGEAATGALINLAGKTTLRELCAFLSLCRVLLTNDTGPMHVAAALGVRVVAPFGSTSPTLTGPGLPGGTRHALMTANASCSPCFLRECPVDFRCMRNITPEQAARAVLEAI